MSIRQVNTCFTKKKQIDKFHSNNLLDLTHMDLMGPTHNKSIGGKKYIFLVIANF